MTLIQKICAGASTAVFASSAGSVISYSVTTTENKETKKDVRTTVKVGESIKYSEFADWPKSDITSDITSDIGI